MLGIKCKACVLGVQWGAWNKMKLVTCEVVHLQRLHLYLSERDDLRERFLEVGEVVAVDFELGAFKVSIGSDLLDIPGELQNQLLGIQKHGFLDGIERDVARVLDLLGQGCELHLALLDLLEDVFEV